MGRPIRVHIDQFCKQCGKKFTSQKDHVKVFKRLLLKHQVENFQCGCPDVPTVYARPYQERTGEDFRLRERHMKIVHLGCKGCEECTACFEAEYQHYENIKKNIGKHVCVSSADLWLKNKMP